MAWLFLAGAIGFEVAATLSLRMATHGRKLWFVAVIAGYIVAFTMLALALDAGMALGVGYGIWAACGVALTAILSKLPLRRAVFVDHGRRHRPCRRRRPPRRTRRRALSRGRHTAGRCRRAVSVRVGRAGRR